MFNNPDNFTLIKSDSYKLMARIKQIFGKYDIKYSIEEKNKLELIKEINIIKETKGIGNRFVVWQPSTVTSWVVFYSNSNDGWNTLIYNLAINYKMEALIIHLDLIDNKGLIGFYYYNDNYKRIVRSLYEETKWTFFEKGHILPFEYPENYKKRIIRQRMNNDILKRYLVELGVNIDSGGFFISKKKFFTGSKN